MATAKNIVIKGLSPDDYDGWLPLWDGNNQGHRNPQVTEETWNRLITPIYSVHGLGGFIDGEMAGLVHYVLHPVTGHIDPVCYMQDVYVLPEKRRCGLAKAMVAHLAAVGKQEKWARIYWLAEEGNEAAQSLYRHFGVRLDFTLHVLPL